MLRLICVALIILQYVSPALSAEFSDKWSPTAPLNAIGRDTCGSSFGHQHPFDVVQGTLNSYLEYKALSPNVLLSYKVKVPVTGLPSYSLVSNTGTANDAFYAEQAFHDCGVFSTYASSNNAEGIWKVGNYNYQNEHDCSALFFSKHPKLKNNVCVMHVIPTCACDLYPNIFSDAELHGELNLAAIPKSKIHSPLLKAIRKDWFDYFEKHQTATRALLLAEASLIQKKYQSMFLEEKKDGTKK